jgi:hypothetical protein
MNGATTMMIVTITGGADTSALRTQIACERRDSADHHHGADVERHQQATTSPRSMTLRAPTVTTEGVAQHRRERAD